MIGTIRRIIAIAFVLIAIVISVNYVVDVSDAKLDTHFVFNDFMPKIQRELKCLADNVYYEARSESDIGKKAVAMTTLNRLSDGRWATSICGVVYERTASLCQFSWICDKSIKHNIVDRDVYDKCMEVAIDTYITYKPGDDNITNGALFYHADYVNPGWKYQRIKQIGRHIFYKA